MKQQKHNEEFAVCISCVLIIMAYCKRENNYHYNNIIIIINSKSSYMYVQYGWPPAKSTSYCGLIYWQEYTKCKCTSIESPLTWYNPPSKEGISRTCLDFCRTNL